MLSYNGNEEVYDLFIAHTVYNNYFNIRVRPTFKSKYKKTAFLYLVYRKF